MKEMTNYEKKIYVNVNPYDANFILTPVFAGMQIGQTFTFNASISNVEERYDLVKWEVFPNEKGVEGISINKTSDINNTGKTAEIKALQDGVFRLKVSFNNTKELEGTVYVEPKKSLKILDESFIQLLPNETRFIGVFVEPEGAAVTRYTDYLEFLTIDYLGAESGIPEYVSRINRITGIEEWHPLKSKYDPEKMKPGMNLVLAITGTDREGYTQIRLTSNYIERMITVNTNYNYQFFMESSKKKGGAFQEGRVVRGKPNDEITIKYNVFPQKDRVSVVPNSWKNSFPFDYGKDMAKNIQVDYLNQTINIILDHCGYAELQFISEYNKENELDMVIPVYVYYDRINLQWKGTTKPGGKSRLDDAQNAIYIADGESLDINFTTSVYSSYSPESFATGFYGEDILFNSVNNSTEMHGKINERLDYVFNSLDRVITIKGEAAKGNVSKIGTDSLLKVEYVGSLTLKYSYSTGGEEPTEFRKTFMAYAEEWSRR
jgi:hypothetical protein